MKPLSLSIILINLLLSINHGFSQNGVFKYKTVRLSFQKITQADTLLSLEIYQNGLFIDEITGNGEKHQQFSKDSIADIYRLSYSYSGIGGGSEPNYLKCPDLFVKLKFRAKHNNVISEYSNLIPLVLVICGNSVINEIEVLDINLNQIINQPNKCIRISENNTYEIINQEDLTTKIDIGKLMKLEFN